LSFAQLVQLMVDADLARVARERANSARG